MTDHRILLKVNVAFEDVGILRVVRPGWFRRRNVQQRAKFREEQLVVCAFRRAGRRPALNERIDRWD